QRLRAEHVPYARVIGLQACVVDFGWPTRIEGGLRRVDGNVGIDERAAANPGALRDPHLVEEAQIDPAVLCLRLVRVPYPGVPDVARICFRCPAPAAFKNEHPPPSRSRASRHDG